MFFQNLSHASELQASKNKAKQQNNNANSQSSSNQQVKSKSDETKSSDEPVPIKYTVDSVVIPRDVILSYLSDCSTKLLEESTINKLVSRHLEEHVQLYDSVIDYQREVMEKTWGIEKEFGSQFLSKLTVYFPNDDEVVNVAKRFMFVAMRSYVNALKQSASLRPQPLLTHGSPFARHNVLEFFEACNATMQMPETKKKLKTHFEQTRQPPNELVIGIQRLMLETLGFDPDYAVSELDKTMDRYPNDQLIAMKMQQFMICANLSCREAMMSEVEKKNFYAQIPAIMHTMPYMWVLQQQLAAQASHGHGHYGAHGHGHGHMQHQPECPHHHHGSHGDSIRSEQENDDIVNEPSPYELIAEMMKSSEAKDKMQAFGTRMQETKYLVEQKIGGWDAAQRQQFYNDFSTNRLVDELNALGTDPLARLNKFMTLGQEDLVNLMTLQACVALDMRERQSQNMPPPESGGVLGGLLSALGSFAGFGGSNHSHSHHHQQQHDYYPHHHDHSHSHGHHHDHGHSCPIHSNSSQQQKVDISTGKSDVMDR